MKKINFRRFSLLLCIVVCMFSLTACSQQISSAEAKKSNKMNYLAANSTSIKEWSLDVINYLNIASDEDIKTNAEAAASLGDITGNHYVVNEEGMNVATIEFFNGWVKTREDLGALVSIDSGSMALSEETGKLCNVTVTATYEKRQCVFELVFDDECNLVSGAINPTYNTGEKMQKAAMNTIIGIGTVFVVLVFISFIISLFKYINVIGDKLSGKSKAEAKTESTGVDNAIAQIVSNEANEEDDLELIAVITAAIAASEGTSSDGLVVRSIRKRR